MNILLGLTGSVATTIGSNMWMALEKLGDVRVVLTKAGAEFSPAFVDNKEHTFKPLTDEDEWSTWHWAQDTSTQKNQSVLHIELRRWASALVIAPLSANTMAKIANGICDNLLTSIVRAWDNNRPIILAPAMNTYMWNKSITEKHIRSISEMFNNVHFVMPINKTLMCGDIGVGAMAHITDIVGCTESALRWRFPLATQADFIEYIDSKHCQMVPTGLESPGAFGSVRKHDIHSGVDLYCNDGDWVRAVEDGEVVYVGYFTGQNAGSPWWNDTECVLIEGASGVVNYGEIATDSYVGQNVKRGDVVGRVVPVLKEGKERLDIPNHSRSMLHVELYEHGTREPIAKWEIGSLQPSHLLDPTELLRNSKR
jgi:phosphopantothenoylcysteine decarboxylase